MASFSVQRLRKERDCAHVLGMNAFLRILEDEVVMLDSKARSLVSVVTY